MPGNIYDIEKLTYPQLDRLDRQRTVSIIAISPLEEHGPHLPIGTDAFNARVFSRHTAEVVVKKHPEFDAAIFPLIPLGTQVYKHVGSFYVKPTTVYDIIYNTGQSMALYGFKYIFVLSAHGPPRQVVAIEAACRKVSRMFDVKMLSLTGAMTAKFLKGEMYDEIARVLGRQFTDEERQLLQYDTHAGWWETSMMLKYYPELVHESHSELKPYLKDILTKRLLTPEVQWQGYFGAPSSATAQFAEASITVFMRATTGLIDRCLKGEDITSDVTSPFYKYLIFRPHFRRNLFAVALAMIFVLLVVLLVTAYL